MPVEQEVAHVLAEFDYWAFHHVRGYEPLCPDADARRARVAEVLWHLDAAFNCGCIPCRHAKRLRPAMQGLHRSEVREDVLGGGTVQANALKTGVIYPISAGHRYAVRPVPVRHCGEPLPGGGRCGTKYEGTQCPNPQCGRPFRPAVTEVRAEDRVVCLEHYKLAYWWGSGPLHRGRHYYRQKQCRTETDEATGHAHTVHPCCH